MSRLLELLLGLPRNFLSQQGELSVSFNPIWPWQATLGAVTWNLGLVALFAYLIVYVYRREGRSLRLRISLGLLRAALATLVLVLLNRPVVTLTQNRTEPSVVAILIDDSLSMRIRDVTLPATASREALTLTRLEAARALLGDSAAGLLKNLARDHTLRLYAFDRDATSLGTVAPSDASPPALVLPPALATLTANGQSTSLATSLARVTSDLAGQRLAAIVLLTDGRETPVKPIADTLAKLRTTTATGGGGGEATSPKVFSIQIGGDRAPRNLSIQNLVLQDAAFSGDLVVARVTLRGTGYAPGTSVTVRLVNAKTQQPLSGISPTGAPTPAQATAVLTSEDAQDIEIPLKPDAVGQLDVAAIVSATAPPGATTRREANPTNATTEGEVDDQDNTRIARISVLDAKVNVLYVEGYPRWDYRFLRTELIRDKSVDVSILLTSADEGVAQDGDVPIRRFPETMDELLPYDAVLIGDVDPRQFTDPQLQLLADYVGKKGGGLLMVAGPRFAPAKYRNTPLEPVLPISLGQRGIADTFASDISAGFRPTITPSGLASGVFRFLPDKLENEQYLKNDLQLVFWFLKGIATKPGAGETLAEHPTDIGPDGKKSPILVAGRYGAGRTLFSAIDDSWRWRYYTGESVFDTYWVQQIRLLARNRKLGQRLYSLSSSRSTYELGEQITITLRILNESILAQLPDRLETSVTTDTTGQGNLENAATPAGALRAKPVLIRQDDKPDTYTATFPADQLGRATVRLTSLPPSLTLPASIANAPATSPDTLADSAAIPIEVIAPRLELTDIRLDRAFLERLATETQARSLPYENAQQALPPLITSAAKTIPLESSRPLWDAPIAMLAFVLLLTTEWILRKLAGMI